MTSHSDAGTIDRRPILDKDADTNEWVLKVARSGWVRIPNDQRALACQIFDAATWAYHNGQEDRRNAIKQALGI
jgi:hypothetical protein